MPDIILKNINDEDVEHEGVTTLQVLDSEGNLQSFINGTAVENYEVSVDFSEGDQTITTEDGVLIKSAVIQKPENLIPENILADVDIAGIIGTAVAGGSGDKPTVIAKLCSVEPGTGITRTLITADEFASAGITCAESNFFAVAINTSYYPVSKGKNAINVAVISNKSLIKNGTTVSYGVIVYNYGYNSSNYTLKVASMGSSKLVNSGTTSYLYVADNALILASGSYYVNSNFYVIAGYLT